MENINTEEKILQSAEIEFVEKGYDGARMQTIADRAGINKALLHYYYRTKDKLFAVVFKTAAEMFFPRIFKIINDPGYSLEQKIRMFVEEYMRFVRKRPQVPLFIIHELSNKERRFIGVFQQLQPDISAFKQQVAEEVQAGRIVNIEAEQLLLNMVSLCILPVVAKPIVEVILLDGKEEEYRKMMQRRQVEVADFIIRAIRMPESGAREEK